MSRDLGAAAQPFAISVNGQPISGLRAGAGASRGLVLALHGGGYDARYWDAAPDLSLLEAGARLGFDMVAIDRPGYRGSATPAPQGIAMREQVPIVFDLIDLLAPAGTPAFVIGHSMGGILTLMMAADPRAVRLAAVDVSGVPVRFPPEMQKIVEQSTEAGKTSATTGSAGRDPDMLRWMFYGDDGSFDPAVTARIDAQNAVPSAEMPDAHAAPEVLPALMGRIRLPVRWTIAAQERSSVGGEGMLAEIRQLMPSCPVLHTSLQPASGHNISAHKVGLAYHLRALAFFEEARALAGIEARARS